MIYKKIAHYVTFNVLGMVGLSCYILADTYFVSAALGAVGLAALNFGISIFSIMKGVGLMIGIGGATLYSLFKGEGKEKKANSAFMHALYLAVLASICFLLLGLIFARPVSILLGASDDTLALTVTYMRTFLLFAPLFILNDIMIAFIRNDNNPKLAMIAMLISSLSNIVLDYIFIFPCSMGIFGAALATGFSPLISLAILSVHFLQKKNSFSLKRVSFQPNIALKTSLLGFSTLIGELASAIALIAFNLVILNMEGTVGVAAYGIVANIALIATAVFTGIAQGIQPLSSTYFGSQDFHSLKVVLKTALIITGIVASFVYLIIYLFTTPIVEIFNAEGNTALAEIAFHGIRIYFIGYFFAGFNIIAASFFSAISSTKEGMIISICRSVLLLLPILFFLSDLLQTTGAWLSFPLTEFLVMLLSFSFLAHTMKKISF